MKVNAVKCPKCNDIIYSRTTHDYHYCSCGAINVDGGTSYFVYGWDNDLSKEDLITSELELDITSEELYNDWNKRLDKYGIIKGNV